MDELTSLAIAAGRGDRGALARFVGETQGDVWRLCAHLVDPAAADDLTQDTYLRAIPALRRFRADAPARTWLLAIARRACAAEIGARSRDRRLTARLAAAPDRALGQPPAEPGAEAAVGELLAALRVRAAGRVRADPAARLLLRGGRGRLRLPGRHDPLSRRPRSRGSRRHDGGPRHPAGTARRAALIRGYPHGV